MRSPGDDTLSNTNQAIGNILRTLEDARTDPNERIDQIRAFQAQVWDNPPPEAPDSALAILTELAYDLEFFVPDPARRSEDHSYFGPEEATTRIDEAIRTLRAATSASHGSAIDLDYRLAPSWLKRSQELDFRSSSIDAVHYDLFLGSVLIRSKEADLSPDWDWVPVLDFAVSLVRIARGLAATGSGRFEFTESDASLDFASRGDQVTITANYAPSPTGTTLAREQLLTASEALLSRMLSELAQRFPDFRHAAPYKELTEELSVTTHPPGRSKNER